MSLRSLVPVSQLPRALLLHYAAVHSPTSRQRLVVLEPCLSGSLMPPARYASLPAPIRLLEERLRVRALCFISKSNKTTSVKAYFDLLKILACGLLAFSSPVVRLQPQSPLRRYEVANLGFSEAIRRSGFGIRL